MALGDPGAQLQIKCVATQPVVAATIGLWVEYCDYFDVMHRGQFILKCESNDLCRKCMIKKLGGDGGSWKSLCCWWK